MVLAGENKYLLESLMAEDYRKSLRKCDLTADQKRGPNSNAHALKMVTAAYSHASALRYAYRESYMCTCSYVYC